MLQCSRVMKGGKVGTVGYRADVNARLSTAESWHLLTYLHPDPNTVFSNKENPHISLQTFLAFMIRPLRVIYLTLPGLSLETLHAGDHKPLPVGVQG